MALSDTKLVPLPPVVHKMYLLRKISLIARADDNYPEKNKMTSTMTPRQEIEKKKLQEQQRPHDKQ